MENQPLIDNTADRQFEMNVDNEICFITYYKLQEDTIEFMHTEVPAKIGGRGLGSLLVKKTLGKAEKEGWKVIPSCSFIARYIETHPEWKKLIE